MRLLELFDRVLPYEVKQTSPHEFDATFAVENIKYHVHIELQQVYAFLNPEFYRTIGNDAAFEAEKEILDDSFRDDEIIAVEFTATTPGSRPSTDPTGTRNEFLVFSTIVNIIKEIIRKVSPKWVMCSGDSPARAKLYYRMIKTLTRSNPIAYTGGYGGDTDINLIGKLR